MKQTYLIQVEQSIKTNAESANQLMGMFEFSGVFSDKLQEKIYSLCWRAIDNCLKTPDNDIALGIYKEFNQIINTYNIFSTEFKVDVLGLFHTVCFHKEK